MRLVRHLFRYHSPLLVAATAGALASALLPDRMETVTRALIGWTLCAWLYLGVAWFTMARASATDVHTLARREDESAGTLLVVIVAASFASVAAIIHELARAKGGLSPGMRVEHVALSVTTLLGGWLLLPTLFTRHYARLHFASVDATGEGLRFPDEKVKPNYWDFAYFAFTIAVASQTADVSIASPRMRRTVLCQSVLSFFFNLAVLGLSVNIVAGLFG
ncbi:DUF1345 domain-containing protein [Chitinasiproducens palmae]|uniref:Uncharacterized membrane protein n=1 Tax=Chitinasiproducens palmae TaxID=1770053 RepID=A0A1H2PW23_9BURK|nr:DUF1345 domain-containing protein [Chitinasiproducens palmae]SDV51523.1 Uncharacterized membrane protein [Chitinasiproducens palmae]